MRNWWKLLAGGLVSLGTMASSASAQYPPPGMMPPGMGGPGMTGGPGMAPGMPTGMGGPGAFAGNPSLNGMPPDFPNAAIPSKEPAAPFSIKDEGMPNAFTELVDRRPHCSQCLVFRSEYLGWWIKPGPLHAPLVSTTTNFAGGEVGAQGEPNSLFPVNASESGVDYRMLNGMRGAMGFALGWLPPIEVSAFSFTRNFVVFGDGSQGSNQYLARPVQLTDVLVAPAAGLNTVEFVNVPGFATGDIRVNSRLSFWNIETNAFLNIGDNGTLRMDFLFGYRHADLYENFEIINSITGVNANVNFGGNSFPTGFTTTVHDAFHARNMFDGGQIGIRTILDCNDFKIFTDLKLAMGSTSHFLFIDGTSTLNPGLAGQPTNTLPGGILALPSNMGSTSTRSFSLIPEVNINLSYQMTQHIRIFGGYNLLYWTNIIRPGDYLNNQVDSRQIPTDQNFINGFQATPNAPSSHVMRNFFAHGFNIGFEIGF